MLQTAMIATRRADSGSTGPPTGPYGWAMVAERFADNNGIKIRYLQHDPAGAAGAAGTARAPVVFIPGISDCADDYLEACPAFVDRPFLVVELRGRGGSDAPPTGYSPADQAGDVRAVLAASEVDRFHLMTFSRGTTPALELALGDPERILTVSIGDYLPGEIGLPPEFADRMWATTWRGRPLSELMPRHVLDGIQAASRPRKLWSELAGLGVPVLVARSKEGGIINDAQEERYRHEVPGVEVVVIPGSGHDLFRTSRTAYPEAVLEFIGRRRPGT